ncbi:MAG TPA: stage III sporulation AC/AD family protein [Lachnoclostridium phocaeense]|uniref:Stage III sporulation AC/AD family protein n=1 Tax=Lachnoclostridium phocaeense TaxID=1871021 RepID=A0A921I1L1_9FIRM|nr:SpoIIIAC/SpoIIIAD family protein [Lachnoclostridium phocaeense]HJF94415.1 stage III sporulation AC/AD family protein [Lachnoclostridium phocaeense]
MDIVQIALLGVAGTLLAIQFKGGKTEYGIYICAGISLLIFFSVIGRISVVAERLQEITAYIDLAPVYIEMLLRMLGITFVAEFSSALCRDAGYQTIAQQIEVFAKLAVLVLGLPVVFSLLEMIKDFLA